MLTVDGAAERIAAGGVVAVPTDTVYGLACDPERPDAVERVYAIKRRPAEMELSLLGASLEDLASCGRVDERVRSLARAFWPGALSVIVPARPERGLAVPRRGTTISLRVPDSDPLRELLRRAGPLATTSANRHGEPAPRTAAECDAALGAEVDGILNGPPGVGLGSTIIDLTEAPPRVLRLGPISEEVLRPFLG